MLKEKTIKKIAPRLRRIEGQVRGISKMVASQKYCIDILQQISAAKGALDRVGFIILENHISTCVKDAMMSKDETEIKEKTEQLMNIYRKFIK